MNKTHRSLGITGAFDPGKSEQEEEIEQVFQTSRYYTASIQK